MFFQILVLTFLLVLALLLLFYSLSTTENWDTKSSSSFECGFSSYFYSRFSFSIHYFIVAMIFLFLDLELCILMPFMNEGLGSKMVFEILFILVLLLFMGLLEEWKEGKLEWKN